MAVVRWQVARRLATVFVVVLALVAASVPMAGPVLAHARLLDSVPGDGVVVSEAPDEIVLVFSEAMQPPATITITDPGGAMVAEGEALVEDDRVRTPLGEPRTDGVYTVEWRAVSADDHPVSGQFTFEVAGLADREASQDQAGTAPGSEEESRALPEEESQALPEGESQAPQGSTGPPTDEPEQAAAGEPAAAAGQGGVLPVLLGAAAALALLGGAGAVLSGRRAAARQDSGVE